MSYYFGLYFGNSNLCLAVCKEGITDVIANAAGDRVTPAYVSFSNGEKLVGLAAKQGMVRNASNTITMAKNLLGGDSSVMSLSQCKVVEEDGFKYEVDVDGKRKLYSSSEALCDLFKNMATIARNHSHETDIPAVVTVPRTYSGKQREKVKMAANEAGFQLLRVINEPAAAALAYDIGQDPLDTPIYCVVYRMGGTSLDVTVIQVIRGLYHILSSVTNQEVNGNLFTKQLTNYCCNEFNRQYKCDVTESKRSIIKVRSASETCKHILSSMGTAQCFAESVFEGIDLSINVSRARFESLISNVLPNCLKPVEEALENANLSSTDISKLVLVGGSCKIPKLQQMLTDMFPPMTVTLCSISPDEVIAIGAAKEAVYVPEENSFVEKDCHMNVLSHSIKANIHTNEVLTVDLFPKGVPIPASFNQSLTFSSCVTHIDLFEVQECDKLLAKLPLDSVKELMLTAHLSKEAILKLSCSDNISQLKKTVTIMPNTD